jgi:hypothetical protein
MKPTTVNIIKQAKINGKWQRYPVAMNKNGSVKPDYILVGGHPVHAPVGNENGKRMPPDRLVLTAVVLSFRGTQVDWKKEKKKSGWNSPSKPL